MSKLEALLASSGIEAFGFSETDSDSGSGSDTRTLVVLLPYDPRLPDVPASSAASEPGSAMLLRIGGFAAANLYAALVRMLKNTARALGRDRSLPKSAFRVCVNSKLPEKSLALSAGLGFMGRSGLFVSRAYGPACVIGALSMPAACAGEIPAADHSGSGDSCGSCSACSEACPTGAIDGTGFVREKCLQHWMSREDFPDSMLKARGNRLYGCDECVRACPRSAGAWARPHDFLLPAETRPGRFIDARDLAGRNAAEVRGAFAGTALGMGWMPHAAWARFASRFAASRSCN